MPSSNHHSSKLLSSMLFNKTIQLFCSYIHLLNSMLVMCEHLWHMLLVRSELQTHWCRIDLHSRDRILSLPSSLPSGHRHYENVVTFWSTSWVNTTCPTSEKFRDDSIRLNEKTWGTESVSIRKEQKEQRWGQQTRINRKKLWFLGFPTVFLM